METHGGMGKLWASCYADCKTGVVFEKLPIRADHLAKQRPTWAVYEADSERAIRDGAGSHLDVNFCDLDPYGEPWPVLTAFFASERPRPDTLVIVANDGMRQNLRYAGGWRIKSMDEMCSKYGNAYLYNNYLAVAKEMIKERAADVGYNVMRRWVGYHCGTMQEMSHYACVLAKA